jgi:predicted Zn finger-like uncharacterized protein
MALITRCPHCATSFRITPLHLQAHGGDVRCGRCAQVFNAFSSLSTIQEPETSDLKQQKTEERRPEDIFKDQPADESSVPAASDQEELRPTPGHEITQTEAHATAVMEERMPPGAIIQEAVRPEYANPETEVSDAVTREAEPSEETRTPEASNPEAEIPEAIISEAVLMEASEASTTSSDASLQQPQASDSATAERLTDGPDMAPELNSPGSGTDTTRASEQIPPPGSGEPVPVEPKANRRKIREPDTRADESRTAKVPTEQTHAKGPAQEEGERKPRETQEQKFGKAPEHEAQAESYAFDTVPPLNISPAWTFASLLLLILFTGQTIYFYRAELAALVPAAKPYLEQYCELLQCTISLPRQPQLLNIESSDMHADHEHPGVITLSATVRNHASYPQAFPLLELTFIDNQNRPLASRIFKPDTYLGEDANLAGNVSPDNEFDVRLHLDTGDLNAAGYRLSLRYPNS